MDLLKISTFIQANMGVISVILLLIMSEILSFKPAWGASGVAKLIYNVLRGEAKKAEPEVVKIIESELPAQPKADASRPPQGPARS